MTYANTPRLPPHLTQANTSKSNVFLRISAQSTRSVLSFCGSFLVAASIATLASPAPAAWGNTPAGTDRRFSASASGTTGKALYKGQSAATTIASGSTVSVALLLQPVTPPVPYENESLIIDSLVVSANVVVPGVSIQLTATAHDNNATDTLAFAWTGTARSFSAPTAAATSAPGADPLTYAPDRLSAATPPPLP